MKYKAKSSIIEAIQWKHNNWKEIVSFLAKDKRVENLSLMKSYLFDWIELTTNKDTYRVEVFDYIVKTDKYIYVVDESIFNTIWEEYE